MQVVLVSQLFARPDISNAADVDAAIFILLGLAVRLAAVVQEHGGSKAIDDLLLAAREEIGYAPTLITDIGFIFGHAGSIVLKDANAPFDWAHGVAACSMDRGGANNKSGNHSAHIITALRVDTVICDASGHAASKLVIVIRWAHIGLLLAVSMCAAGRMSIAQSVDQSSPAPCATTAQPDTCGSKPASGDKKSPAEKFPFPGQTTSQPDSSAAPVNQAPRSADPPSAPPAAGVSPDKKFPFPGDSGTASKPAIGPTSGSSSSSSSDGEPNPADAASSPDANPTPELQDKGSEGQKTVPGRHILHRVNPPGTKLQSPEERAAEDVDVARFYMDTGDFNAAYLRGKDAVKLLPDDPSAHFTLAEAAMKLDKREEAIEHYQQCLKLDPIDKEAKAAKKALSRLQARR